MTVTYPDDSLLMEPDELAGLLDSAARDTLRVFDCTVFLEPAETGYRAVSGLGRYREQHIPGAAFMDLIRALSDTSTGLGFSRPAPDELQQALGQLGISAQHSVVLYSTGHMMWATRGFWLLRYAGHRNVRVLNGGLRAWTDAGGAVTSGQEHHEPARFQAQPAPELFVDLEETRAAMGDDAVCTVNALSPEMYAGSGDHHYGRRGHIPGSRNLHYDALLERGRFRPADQLRDTLKISGMLDAPRVITYCGGGISATIDAFACLLLGRTDVAVYDGSMSEWVRDDSLPLKEGMEP